MIVKRLVILVNRLMKVNCNNTMRNFGKIFKVLFEGAIITSLLIPVLLLAQGNAEKGICARLSTLSLKIDERFANFDARLEAKRTETANRIETRQNEFDARLTEKRAKWDANRDEHFAKLEEKAQTDVQKQALLAFRETVTAAISARRAAIDTANQNFREGVQDAIASRKSAVDTATTTFRNSLKAAFDKANSDCQAGVDPRTVRENLGTDLKAARDKFASDRQEIEKLKTPMETLINTRKEAIKKAIDDFKAAIEKAKTDFKAAFPTSSAPAPAE